MNTKKRNVFWRVCGLLLAAALLFAYALPALAEDGDMGTMVEPGGEDDGSGDGVGPVEPDPGTDPDPGTEDPTPPPADDPTPPPADDPTPPPSDEPTPPVTDDPTASPGPDEPTPPPDGGDETPTPEPTDEPVYVDPNPGGTTGGNTGETTNNGGSTGPRNPGGTVIAQPSFSPRSTPPPIQSSSSQAEDPADKEPRWITFARVTQRTNSMSRVLFYGGASCIGAGSLGLLVLLIFIIRNRHIDARNERIFEEIAQAETRQPAGRPARQQDYAGEEEGYGAYEDGSWSRGGTGEDEQAYFRQDPQGYDAPPPRVDSPEPESLTVPVNGSLYTEEFDIPQQARYAPQEPVRPAQAPPPVQAPPRASMYTEEFTLPEEMVQPAPAAPRRAAPPVQAPPPRQDPPASYDTTELLREILHSGEEDR